MAVCCALSEGACVSHFGSAIHVTSPRAVRCEIDGTVQHFESESLFDAIQLAQDALDQHNRRISLLFYNPHTRRFLGDEPCPVNSRMASAAIEERLDAHFVRHDGYRCFFRAGTKLLTLTESTDVILKFQDIAALAFALDIGAFTEDRHGQWVSATQTMARDALLKLVLDAFLATSTEHQLQLLNRFDPTGEYYLSWCDGKVVRFSLLG